MKAILRWIATNLPLAILAFVLATLTWIVAAEQADPTRTDDYPQGIPITVTGKPEDMVIVGGLDEQVHVTIRAPESVWQSIRQSDLSASVDLTGLNAGIHEIPIDVELAKSPTSITWEPRALTLELAYLTEQMVPVQIELAGEPALGYLADVPTVTPRYVTVSGPSTYVTRVTRAVAQVSVHAANANMEGEYTLQPSDSEGELVPYVTLTPEEVHVSIAIELSEEYRTVAINPVRVGLPAFGHTITGFAVDPGVVTVSGAPEAIAALPGYIETESINVEGAESDVVARPALNVPPGIIVVSGQPVTVTFFIEAIQSSLILAITPTLQGLEPGITATVSPPAVEVFLSGPMAHLETLEAREIRIILDLLGLSRGTHQIDLQIPQIVVPEGLTIRSILPATVQVEILTTPTGN